MIPSFPNPHLTGCFWHNLAENFGAADNKVCEEVVCGIIAGPANTWSNLAYFAAAIYLFRINRKFAAFIFSLGTVSFFAHASITFPALLIDLFMSFTLIFWFTFPGKKYYLALIGMVVCYMLMMSGRNYAYLIPMAAAWPVLSELKSVRQKKNLFVSLGFFGFAFLFAAIDRQPGFCSPESWIQGHSLWHFFTALAVIFLGKHFSQVNSANRL